MYQVCSDVDKLVT